MGRNGGIDVSALLPCPSRHGLASVGAGTKEGLLRSLTARLRYRPVQGLRQLGSVVCITVALVSALGAMSIAHAFEGFQVQHPLFHPGLVDFHQRVNDGGDTTNLALWTPVFRGGVGRIDLKHGPTLRYAGGFLSTLAAAPNAGELILAAQTLSRTGVEAWETQGKYRLPIGVLLPGALGVGGGYVSQDRFGPDIWFTKFSYRDALRYGWQTIASVQLQEVGQQGVSGSSLESCINSASLHEHHSLRVYEARPASVHCPSLDHQHEGENACRNTTCNLSLDLIRPHPAQAALGPE